MTHKFHITTNSNSLLNLIGWISIIIAIAMLFTLSSPVPIAFLIIGGSIIWLTTKKKIYKVDTDTKELHLGDLFSYSNPEKVIINTSKESQVVNSRTQTTTVYTSYYVGYLMADGESYLISKNKKLETDLDALLQLGKDLAIEVEQLY